MISLNWSPHWFNHRSQSADKVRFWCQAAWALNPDSITGLLCHLGQLTQPFCASVSQSVEVGIITEALVWIKWVNTWKGLKRIPITIRNYVSHTHALENSLWCKKGTRAKKGRDAGAKNHRGEQSSFWSYFWILDLSLLDLQLSGRDPGRVFLF